MRKSVVRALRALTACALAWPAARVAAQVPAIGSSVRVRLSYRDALAPVDSDYVWDSPPGAPVLQGRLSSWTDTMVVLQRDAKRDWKIRVTRMDWVEVASGRGSRSSGAVRGGIMGALAGPVVVLFGYARHYVGNDPVPPHAPIRRYQISAYAGAAVGAAIGAMLPGPRWVRVFTRAGSANGSHD